MPGKRHVGGGGGRGKPPGAKRPVGGGGDKLRGAVRRKRGGRRLQEDEIKVVLDFVEKNPGMSYTDLERALPKQTGIEAGQDAIRRRAVKAGVRKGIPEKRRNRSRAAIIAKVRKLDYWDMQKLEEFIRRARVSAPERRLLMAALVEDVDLRVLAERFEPFDHKGLENRVNSISARINLGKFLGSLPKKPKKQPGMIGGRM